MKYFYRCQQCGEEFPGNQVLYLCPECSSVQQAGEFPSGLLEVILDLPPGSPSGKVAADELSPLPLPGLSRFPAGNTPLAEPVRLREICGLNQLTCKLEFLNPSGSFKDRASLMVAAQAIAHGESTVALSSTGNAGSAMACAGAAFGLKVILFVPEHAPKNKLMQSVLYGAEVLPIRGGYDQAFSLSIAYTQTYGGINRNTAYNPMTVEGKKSCAVELYNQYGRDIPDAVYIPVGDGVIFSGIYKGFRDLRDLGYIERLPRLICVQSERSNAVSRAWESSLPAAVSSSDTAADSISVVNPAGGRYALKGLKESEGWCTVVSDEEILQAQLELSREAGMFCEPAAAASWAGCRADAPMLRERFGPDVKTAVLLTGSGFKDMDVFTGRVGIPEAVEPRLEACVERIQHT